VFEQRDISTKSDGELNTEYGDLKISTATESLLNSVNFCLLTAINAYKPKIDFGASPENYLGKPNSKINRNYIRMYIDYALREQGILDGPEYTISVVPVSEHEIAVIMKIDSIIFEIDENAEPKETIIAYKYDFNNGTLDKVE
jgi:hypothetical protein